MACSLAALQATGMEPALGWFQPMQLSRRPPGAPCSPIQLNLIRHGKTKYLGKDCSICSCEGVRDNVAAAGISAPELLVCSPQTRALQTALIGFGTAEGPDPLLAYAGREQDFPMDRARNVRFPASTRVVIQPLAAEHGRQGCSVGSYPLSGDAIRDRWGAASFTEQVAGWDLRHSWREELIYDDLGQRLESKRHFQARIRDLVTWLRQQPESSVTIVFHSEAMQELIRQLHSKEFSAFAPGGERSPVHGRVYATVMQRA